MYLMIVQRAFSLSIQEAQHVRSVRSVLLCSSIRQLRLCLFTPVRLIRKDATSHFPAGMQPYSRDQLRLAYSPQVLTATYLQIGAYGLGRSRRSSLQPGSILFPTRIISQDVSAVPQ